MKLEEFIKVFEEEVVNLPHGSITLDTNLTELDEWDSVAFVGLVAVIDEYLDLRVKAQDLKSIQSFSDLIALVKEKIEE